MRLSFAVLFLCLSSLSVSADESAQAAFTASDSIAYYQARYGLTDVYQKRVDNQGNGFEDLYGTRNFRAVLNGVIFRGGANNAYHRTAKRSNMNPLPSDGLQNLCEEGFGHAVYLYTTNFNSAPKLTQCVGPNGQKNELDYRSIEPLSGSTEAGKILRLVHDSLTGQDQRPVYLHCWNGWHASGYISALSLRQFCGWSGDQAVNYWKKNTDGNADGHSSILAKIRTFQPDPSLQIPTDLQARVCPSSLN